MRPRDSQRSKVYKAERKAFDGMNQPTFKTIDECDKYIQKVQNSDYWTSNGGWQTVRAKRKSRGRGAYITPFDGGTMHLPISLYNQWVIIHEMAHCLEMNIHGFGRNAAHGPEFCTHYAHLVHAMLGDGAASLLVSMFNEHKVKHEAQHFLDAVVAEFMGVAA